LTVNFKKPLYTPKVVLVRGQVVKKEGRKLSLKGSFEDEEGNILVEAEGTWIMVNRDVGRSNVQGTERKSNAKL
jgi:acyl-CoA thioesterase FadM